MEYTNIDIPVSSIANDKEAFYYIDYTVKLLFKITSTGKIICAYNLITFDDSYTVLDITFDGFYIWVLSYNEHTFTYLITIRSLDDLGFQSLVVKQFYFDNIQLTNAKTLSLESYTTKLVQDYIYNTFYIVIEEYYDRFIFNNSILVLKNKSGFFEYLDFNYMSGNKLFFNNRLKYAYTEGSILVIVRSFFIFSDFSGGALLRYNASSGKLLQYSINTDYSAVNASIFARVTDKLSFYKDVHTIMYVKGSLLKLLATDNLLGYAASVVMSDDFESSSINPEKWQIVSGYPTNVSGTLSLPTSFIGTTSVKSTYILTDQFKFKTEIFFDLHTTCSGSAIYDFYVSLDSFFSNTSYKVGYLMDTSECSVLRGCPYIKINNNITYLSTLSGTSYIYTLYVDNDNLNIDVQDINGNNVLNTTTLEDFNFEVSFTQHTYLCDNISYIKYFTVSSGTAVKDLDVVDYYGVLTIDNLEADGSTLIPVDSLAHYDDNVYRLQNKTTFYGTTYDYNVRYNYQITPLTPFQDFITMAIYPKILPATTHNYAEVSVIVKDQYTDGLQGEPILMEADDTIGYINDKIIYTNYFNYSGKATTMYTSGIADRIVTIKASVI